MFTYNKKHDETVGMLNWKTVIMDIVLVLFTALVIEQVIMQWGWFTDDLAFWYVDAILAVVKLFCKGAVVMLILLLLWIEAVVT